ncbi:uncharacterized protein LOC129592238 [Paramacrobiotus metropolitanus]|uniref:uncharacterized protein LOC129592238 n=1 Tax=Paramacrobiotus metropolitanus TaxID=2943436 RepID=UPI002445B5F4|nr:uncharacterized protein LOC129592238 [Paramacrobiotus metropolitanus]
MHCAENGGYYLAQQAFLDNKNTCRLIPRMFLNDVPLQIRCSFTVPDPPPRVIHCKTVQLPFAEPQSNVQTGKEETAQEMYDLTPTEKQEILNLFDNGRPCFEIMRKANLSRHCIKRVLAAAGRTVTFRKQDRKRYETLRPMVLELFKRGWSYLAITRQAETSMLWVKQIIREANLAPRAPSESLRFRKNPVVRILRHPERRDSWIGYDHAPASAGLPVSSSTSGFDACCSILLDDRHRRYTCATTENAEFPHQENGIAKKDSATRYHAKMDIAEDGIETDVAGEKLSSCRRSGRDEITEYSSTSPDRCMEVASEIPSLWSEHESMSGRTRRYECQMCRSWDEGEAFLTHFSSAEHELLYANGTFLYCTGCKFKTRKPAKMGRHIIKYQSQNTQLKCNIHSVKTVH